MTTFTVKKHSMLRVNHSTMKVHQSLRTHLKELVRADCQIKRIKGLKNKSVSHSMQEEPQWTSEISKVHHS
jgi:hypothetical protein